ncbi:MAG: hypothetical protein AB4040_01285 [Synechococcus sp.]
MAGLDNGPEDSVQQLADDRSISVTRDVVSSTLISGDNNQVKIYYLSREREEELPHQPVYIGPNPYVGLSAFQEADANQYFGRETQIEQLWELLRNLHESRTEKEITYRLLPILGPSGCGKSSLARAGLIPELARRSLPGTTKVRVALFTPGTHPIEALAGVLARNATNDPTPAAKAREFEAELGLASKLGEYDGLRRIVNLLPDSDQSPLILLVDQFEEVYSLCKDLNERVGFIENLLLAAGDRAGRVTVVLTLRSDFLGETQRHPKLNRLIASQLFVVPAMSEGELRRAISMPAERAGHPLDMGTVNRLIEETKGREGALPLLQFALTQIWEGMAKGIDSSQTLNEIGGVGGALAGEAQRIYDSLGEREQEIAKRIFLGLVQLGEGSRDTRRRAVVDSLLSHRDKPEWAKQVIEKFSSRGARLITLSGEVGQSETAEVTHEALLEHWDQLNEWLDNNREDIRFQRRLDEAAKAWEEEGRHRSSLWARPRLDLLEEYVKSSPGELTKTQIDFFKASRTAEKVRKLGVISGIGILCTLLLLTAWQWQQSQRQLVIAKAQGVDSLLSTAPTRGLTQAIEAIGMSRSLFLRLPDWHVPGIVTGSLLSAVEHSRESDILSGHQHDGVWSLALTQDDSIIVSGSGDGTIRLWNLDGKSFGEPFRGHDGRVLSVAVGENSSSIVSGGEDGTVRLWQQDGTLIGQPFQGHEDRVLSVAISDDGSVIVSGGEDGTVRLWHPDGRPEGDPFLGHQKRVWSVAISQDGSTVVSGGADGTVRLWRPDGSPIGDPFQGHQGIVRSVAISEDGSTIVSGGEDGSIRLWLRDGTQIGQPFQGHQGIVRAVAISQDGSTIVSGGEDSTVRLWQRDGTSIGRPFLGHQGIVRAVALSESESSFTILSGGYDATIRLWQPEGAPLEHSLQAYQGNVRSIAISEDGSTIASGGEDGTLRLWQPDGTPIGQPLASNQGIVRSIAMSEDGSTIVSGGEDGTVRLWRPDGNPIGEPFTGHQGIVRSVTISEDGSTIVSGGEDGTVKLWKPDGTPIGNSITGHQGIVMSVAISEDGSTIVSGSRDGTVRLWKPDGTPIGSPFTGHRGWVNSVALSDDNATIVSGGEDGTVRLWEPDGSPIGEPFTGHQGIVISVGLSGYGSSISILSGGNDGTVRLWQPDGTPVGEPFRGHNGIVNAVAVNENGSTIVSGGNDGTVRLWSFSWETLLDAACWRLHDHAILENPFHGTSAFQAKRTCEQYVWSRSSRLAGY